MFNCSEVVILKLLISLSPRHTDNRASYLQYQRWLLLAMDGWCTWVTVGSKVASCTTCQHIAGCMWPYSRSCSHVARLVSIATDKWLGEKLSASLIRELSVLNCLSIYPVCLHPRLMERLIC